MLSNAGKFISDLPRYWRLAREGGWIVLGQIAAVAGAIFLVRVLTRYLDVAQYGQLALGLTVAGLANQVIMGGASAGIGRFYPIAVEKGDLPGYFSAVRTLMGITSAAVLAVGSMLLSGLYFLGYSQWMGLTTAALVFSVLWGYNSTLNGIQNAARQRATVALHSGVEAWLKILLAVGVMFWLGISSTAVVIGYAIASLVVTASQLVFLRRLFVRMLLPVQENAGGTPWARQIWHFSWPFSAWGVFTWIHQISDRWALEVFATTDEVGLYAVLYQLGYTPVVLVTGLAVSFFGPILFQRAGDATDGLRNANAGRLAINLAALCLCTTGIAFLFALGLHAWLFRLVVDDAYRVVSHLLPWVVLAGGLFATGQIFTLRLMSAMRSVTMVWAKVVTAVLGVLLNIMGASFAGIQGIVGALLIFSCIYLGWMAYLTRRLAANSVIK